MTLKFMRLEAIKAFCWVDTRDNVANVLTKFSQTGLLELDEIAELYETASWEPTRPYRWHADMLSDPEIQIRIKFAPPLPPTKAMHDKAVKVENPQFHDSSST